MYYKQELFIIIHIFVLRHNCFQEPTHQSSSPYVKAYPMNLYFSTVHQIWRGSSQLNFGMASVVRQIVKKWILIWTHNMSESPMGKILFSIFVFFMVQCLPFKLLKWITVIQVWNCLEIILNATNIKFSILPQENHYFQKSMQVSRFI